MPASSMTYFDDCEANGLSSSSCAIFFYYTTIRKSSICIVIRNVSQKCIINIKSGVRFKCYIVVQFTESIGKLFHSEIQVGRKECLSWLL